MPYRALIVAALASLCQSQFQTFLTRPNDKAVTINITTNKDPSALAPGYIFLAPYISDSDDRAYGPQIFDHDGTLIWYGNDCVEKRAMDVHICDFKGNLGNHICFNDAYPIQQGGHSSGVIRFFDNTYTQVGNNYGATNGVMGPDIHELNTPNAQNGGSFIQDMYMTEEMNLSDYGGPNPGYVLNGCFQEIQLGSGKLLFQWCSLDYIPLHDTYVNLAQSGLFTLPIAGDGSQATPWDYFHINSVGRNVEGDYVVSARHTDTIYKIAGNSGSNGKPGSVIWYLNGKRNQFDIDDGAVFSRQHNVRFLSTGRTTTTLSILDNASDGFVATAPHSSGKLLTVNNSTMTVSLANAFPMPNGLLSYSQGSLQVLANGNAFLGWGCNPYFSEYNSSGTLLYHAHFGAGLPMESFRAWKFPWRGFPMTAPDIVAYARNCSAPTIGYVSWNGATEVAKWTFYTATMEGGPFNEAGNFSKAGFETVASVATGFAPYVFAVAADARGVVLGITQQVRTFVPVKGLLGCTEMMCPQGTDYTAASNSMGGDC